MTNNQPLTICNKTRQPTPRGPFLAIKRAVLGERYELSLVFCGRHLSRRLNRTYRDKDYATNVLAFPVSKTSGEIFINLSGLKGWSVLELFIHALFHLNGMEHGAKMERAELKILKTFHVPTNHRRH